VAGGTLHTWTDISGLGRVQNSILRSNNLAAFASLSGTQVTESENHPEWKTRNKRVFQGDMGGPFVTRKRYALGSPNMVNLRRSIGPFSGRTDGASYDGPLLPIGPGLLQFPPFFESDDVSLAKVGTRLMADLSPSAPLSEFLTAAAELFNDGLPSEIGLPLIERWGRLPRKARRRAIGNEYLNYQFGWVPLVSDLLRLQKSVRKSGDILSKFIQDSGQVVYRKGGLPPEEKESFSTFAENINAWYAPSSGTLDDNSSLGKGKVVRTHKQVRFQSFSGACTYFIPPSGGLINETRRAIIEARRLFGVAPTPDTIWNLAPWSWAVDWFSTWGAAISNFSDYLIDGQVWLYAYAMEHSISSYTYTYVGPTGYYPKEARPYDVILISEVKKRIKASPYGFFFGWEQMSARQKLIAAALGLTR
jgi:hypothetical protein